MSSSTSPKPSENGSGAPGSSGKTDGLTSSNSDSPPETAKAEIPSDQAGADGEKKPASADDSAAQDTKAVDKPDAPDHSASEASTEEAPADLTGDTPEDQVDPASAKTGAEPAPEDDAEDSSKPSNAGAKTEDTDAGSGQPAEQETAAKGADEAPDTDGESDPEDTLDLRALFASSEPEFADPTDTFELARNAKVERGSEPASRQQLDAESGKRAPDSAAGGKDDDESPLDLPLPEAPLDALDGDRNKAADSDSQPRNEALAEWGRYAASRTSENANDHGSGTFDSASANDPLADAVQSALRSVYGDADESREVPASTNGADHGADGPVLQWAGPGTADETPQDHAGSTHGVAGAEASNQFGGDTAIDEDTTEAVLSYLYEHIDGEDGFEADVPENYNVRIPRSGADDDYVAQDAGEADDQVGWNRTMAVTGARGEPGTAFSRSDGDRESGARESLSSSADAAAALDMETEAGTFTPTSPADEFGQPLALTADDGGASGKLLGAAGLGLIGGIAVAGVAAVFVFNSFVTKDDPARSGAPTEARLSDTATARSDTKTGSGATSAKTETRLRGEQTRTSGTQSDASDPAATTATTTSDREPASQTPDDGADRASAAAGLQTSGEPPAPAADSKPSTFEARDVAGASGEAIPLALSVPESAGDSFVRIAGLPERVKLSAGVDTGNGSWLLSAGRADDLSLRAPETFSGVFTLQAHMLESDARTPLGEPVAFKVRVAETADRPAAEPRIAAIDPDTAPAVVDQPPGIVARARSLLRAGDVRTARQLLEAEAENGNAEAALVMGESFDPLKLRNQDSVNARPDATEAFRWYKRAVQMGQAEGNARITELKNWLLQ